MANTFLTPSIIARQALARLYSTLTAAQLVNRNYESEFQRVGDTITVRKPTVFSANEYAGSIVVQDATEASVSLALDTHADVSFAVSSTELTLEIADFDAQLLTPAMEAIAQKIDTDVITALVAAAQAAPAQAVEITAAADIVDARKLLNDAKAPNSERYGIWSPGGEAVLLKDALFHQADQSGSTAGLVEASVGRKFGIDHFMSQNASDYGVIFHRNAVLLATRPLAVPMGAQGEVVNYKGLSLRVVMDYDMDSKTDTVSVDVLYGLATAYPELAVELTAPSV